MIKNKKISSSIANAILKKIIFNQSKIKCIKINSSIKINQTAFYKSYNKSNILINKNYFKFCLKKT